MGFDSWAFVSIRGSNHMIDGIRFKVCGLTSLVDAEFADRCGADYLGFIFFPKSPRHISLEQYRAMAARLPDRRRVAVSVEPTLDELGAMRDAGFDFFQIHFRPETTDEQLTAWSRLVGEKHLWLAPKLPAGAEVSSAARAVAKFVLLDTFHNEAFGGTGHTGDWGKFARHQAAYPGNIWILAGGLNPANIGEALAQTNARFVDVNSGVESAPGVKDETKLKAFVVALHHAALKRAAAAGPAVT
jgi:phosphoribosylanthranilate isomerase